MLGPRANIEYEIRDRKGIVQSAVTEDTDYLVIGNIGSADWLHSTHGRKIEKAVALVERGRPITIVSEEHWADHLLQPLKTNNRHD
jgi:NAD-dependent DNA ligase